MTVIAHRELRNNSSEILRRVSRGESFEITNHGKVVARIVPPAPKTGLEKLREAGLVRPATQPFDIDAIKPQKVGVSTKEILDDLRGDR